MESITITGCSMGCLYATGPIDKCLCQCKGEKHSLLAEGIAIKRVECSPAAAKRCKEGNESGECECLCKGANHGLYKTIEDYSNIKITTFA